MAAKRAFLVPNFHTPNPLLEPPPLVFHKSLSKQRMDSLDGSRGGFGIKFDTYTHCPLYTPHLLSSACRFSANSG